jgi:hypothetical protein
LVRGWFGSEERCPALALQPELSRLLSYAQTIFPHMKEALGKKTEITWSGLLAHKKKSIQWCLAKVALNLEYPDHKDSTLFL